MTDILFTPLRLSELETLIQNSVRKVLGESQNLTKPEQPETDRWFDLSEICAYLPDKPAKQTVYGWVHDSLIPCHKGAKKLRFLKSDIDLWLKGGRKKTLSETALEADQYLAKRRGRV